MRSSTSIGYVNFYRADDRARDAGDHSVLDDDALGLLDASVGTAATARFYKSRGAGHSE